MAVRNDSGCFDISHMGIFEIKGNNAKKFIQKISCNDVNKADGGKMIYSMILNPEGGIKDDIMYGYLENRYIMIVNASNRKKIMDWFLENNDEDVSISEKNNTHSMIAVQGPQAFNKLSNLLGIDLSDITPFSIATKTFKNNKIILSRTGYTGEDGFECIIPNEMAKEFWGLLQENKIKPCGLGCRDSLRLEKGLPLYGQELTETITPFMTRYKWVVKMDTDFIGKKALEENNAQKPALQTVGIEMKDRIIPRSHYPIVEGGEVSSGTLSPSLDKPIGLALINSSHASLGNIINVSIRKNQHEARIVTVPFQ